MKYLQKMDKDSAIKSNVLRYHPELKKMSNHEVDALTKIERVETTTTTTTTSETQHDHRPSSSSFMLDEFHRTLPFLTKYEKARILGERTKQLNDGAQPFIKLLPEEKMIDGYAIALKEFEARSLPFIIKRPLPNGHFEFWKLSDLECI